MFKIHYGLLVSLSRSFVFYSRNLNRKMVPLQNKQNLEQVSSSIIISSEKEEIIKLDKKIKNNMELKKAALEEIKRENNPKLIDSFTLLPKTENFEEIIQYFNKFKSILKEQHYLIILSRLAHLKNAKSYKLDPRLHEIIQNVCKIKIKSNPKYLSNFIKYSAMIGIQNKLLWRKLISDLYKTDFQRSLTEFCLSLNYLQVHGILNKKIINFMQDKAIEMLERNVENQSFKSMELLLNSLKNFKIKPELLTAIEKRVNLHIHMMPLKNLRNCFIPTVQMKTENQDLWSSFHKWIYIRMADAKKKDFDTIQENFSYLLFTYAKSVDENIFNMREIFSGDQYKDLRNIFYEIFEEHKEKLFYQVQSTHFLRIFQGFSLMLVNYANKNDEINVNYLLNYLLKNSELRNNMKMNDFYEVFLSIIRMQRIYPSFKNHENLLSLLSEKLFSKCVDLPIIVFKTIIEFFFEEKENFINTNQISAKNMEEIISLLKNVLDSIVKTRIFNKDHDFIIIEQVIGNFKKNNVFEGEEANYFISQIKR